MRRLRGCIAPEQEVAFELSPRRTKPIGDASLLTAVVGLAGTALGALITGLFQIAREQKASRVTVVAADGTRIEAPVDAPTERIQEIADVVRSMGDPKISIR